MDFVFQGFQSALPVWVYMLLFLGSLGIAWWSYRHIKAVSPFYRTLLVVLRATAFLVLLVILLNPFYKAESTYLENPELLVFLDNSESTTLSTGTYNGLESYRQVLEKLNFVDSSEVNYSIFAFGGELRPTGLDSMQFNDDQTNLYDPLQVIKNQDREIAGAIIISDGIFNQDRNPVFESETINKPIFTVGLGDTIRQKDLIVKNVVTNATGYVNTRHPVEVTVINNGFDDGSFEVQITKDGEVVTSQRVTISKGKVTHTLDFEIPLTEKGLRQYVVTIPELEQEWSAANNEQPFGIDIIDEKQQILSLAFEVHPDVKAVRSLLLSDTNTDLKKRTWLGGSRFLEGDFNFTADSLDLIMMQGFPNSGLPASITEKLATLLDKVPAIFIASPKASYQSFSSSFDLSLPVLFQGNTNINQVGLISSVSATKHPVMELPEVNYSSLASIYAPIQGMQLSEGATMLFEGTYLGRTTSQPMISVQELGNLRTTFIAGYGWYRIFQSSNPQQHVFVEKLFENIVSWTATKPDNRRLRIEPVKKIFTGAESVILNGFLKNESGQMESNATIDISLSGEDIEERFYSMENTGSGQYRLELGTLPQGLYQFTGTANKGNRTIDTQQGEFSVSKSNAEYVNTIRNDQLMSQIAENTGGNYFLFNELDGFRDSLNKKGMLSKKEKISETLFFPYQHSFWFIIVIALLGAEWIIRKYFALP